MNVILNELQTLFSSYKIKEAVKQINIVIESSKNLTNSELEALVRFLNKKEIYEKHDDILVCIEKIYSGEWKSRNLRFEKWDYIVYRKSLRNAKKYDEIINIYKKDYLPKGEWDYRFYAAAFRGKEEFNEAMEICKIGLQKFPNSEIILSEQDKIIFSRDFKKKNMHDIDEEGMSAFANKVTDKYKNSRFEKIFYNRVVMYVMEYYYCHHKWTELEKWASKIDVNTLSKNDSFINKHGEHIVYVSEKSKYDLIYSDFLIENGKIDAARTLLVPVLKEDKSITSDTSYPTDNKYGTTVGRYIMIIDELIKENNQHKILDEVIEVCKSIKHPNSIKAPILNKFLELIELVYNERGIGVIYKLLSEIGFKEDNVREKYLKSLLAGGKINHFKEWGMPPSRAYSSLSIFNVIVRLLKEKQIKQCITTEINPNPKFNPVTPSKVGDFVFCPASYSINLSINTIEEKLPTDIDWSDKKMLIERIEAYRKNLQIEDCFSAEERRNLKIPDLIYLIIKSNLKQESKRNTNPLIFSNTDNSFQGCPDYWFIDNGESFIVEEVFTDYNEERMDSLSPYLNHSVKTLSMIVELNKVNAKKGYIIYWLGDIVEKNSTANSQSPKIQAYKLRERAKKNIPKKEYDYTLLKITFALWKNYQVA